MFNFVKINIKIIKISTFTIVSIYIQIIFQHCDVNKQMSSNLCSLAYRFLLLKIYNSAIDPFRYHSLKSKTKSMQGEYMCFKKNFLSIKFTKKKRKKFLDEEENCKVELRDKKDLQQQQQQQHQQHHQISCKKTLINILQLLK